MVIYGFSPFVSSILTTFRAHLCRGNENQFHRVTIFCRKKKNPTPSDLLFHGIEKKWTVFTVFLVIVKQRTHQTCVNSNHGKTGPIFHSISTETCLHKCAIRNALLQNSMNSIPSKQTGPKRHASTVPVSAHSISTVVSLKMKKQKKDLNTSFLQLQLLLFGAVKHFTCRNAF